jgi:hypothetical protein
MANTTKEAEIKKRAMLMLIGDSMLDFRGVSLPSPRDGA